MADLQKPQTFNGDLAHLPVALERLTAEPRWVVWRWEPRHWREDSEDWHGIAYECQEHGGRLNQREQNFVADMVAWTAFREPTQKQQAWLLSIHRSVRRHG